MMGRREGARYDEETWEREVEGEKRSGKKNRLWGESGHFCMSRWRGI